MRFPNWRWKHEPSNADLSQQLNLMRTEIMSTLNDIVADEAALKTANGQLIQLAANTLATLNTLKSDPSLDPTAQAKIDALHTALTSDLNDVTSALTADSTPVDPPAAATIPGTGGATGQ